MAVPGSTRTGPNRLGQPKPDSPPPSTVSPQEKEKRAALQAQHKACQAFKEFLSSHDDADDADGDLYEDDDGGGGGWEEFEVFFVRVFMENHEMRGYYQRNFENGEFCCLVCGGIGKKKSGKRFKGCFGLVQHSMSILRTVEKRAHRAFGLAVCKVLGWDVDRLPTIVMKGSPLGLEMNPPQAEVINNNVTKILR
ncbi:uncharacterized protein LOC113866033 [Abrus precatorius]|uniref:Uncharacterized protein LOC113866033 n=1 Tax=Abrus precatorius TaxID=3816 RepID=A0A8B8LKD3_ABRPR|nr:uncharacterized protein LOC113866033 [Abrus precatorius]